MNSVLTFFHYDIPWWKRWGVKVLPLIAVILLTVGAYTQHVLSKKQGVQIPLVVRQTPTPFPTVAPYPVNVSGTYPGSDVSASGVIVFDIGSGVYLYKRNEEMQLSPASTTKIMTALVSLDAYKLSDVLTIDKPFQNGQSMGLYQGERITVENVLYGALIQSGNDAATALADNYPGGQDAFVAAMNEKAQNLHMVNTHFTNPTGYDDLNHKMTALDLTRLATVALENPTIAKMVAIPQITVSDVTHTHYHKLANVNQLLGKIPGVAGIKTGWTEEAGENLVTYLDRDGKRLVFVVLHSKDRFVDTVKLIDWVFANYKWEQYSTALPTSAVIQ